MFGLAGTTIQKTLVERRTPGVAARHRDAAAAAVATSMRAAGGTRAITDGERRVRVPAGSMRAAAAAVAATAAADTCYRSRPSVSGCATRRPSRGVYRSLSTPVGRPRPPRGWGIVFVRPFPFLSPVFPLPPGSVAHPLGRIIIIIALARILPLRTRGVRSPYRESHRRPDFFSTLFSGTPTLLE